MKLHRSTVLYCRLGETNQALEWLQKAYKERSPRMEELKEEPAFDCLDLASRP